jgi:cation diffusion facilitator family transporter
MKDKNYKKIQYILFVILILNIIVAVSKIVMGNISKSSAMSADGFASLADGLSNVIAIVGVYLASKPEDEDHQYGHGKIEIITGLIIGLFLLYAGFNVVIEAIGKIKNPVDINISPLSLLVMLFTLVINIIVAYYEYKKGNELNSPILIADSLHTKSDIFVTVGVIIALILIRLGMSYILDPVASFVVSLMIFYAAYNVFKENINILIDVKIVDDKEVKNLVMTEYPCVKEMHKIRSRGTKNNVFMDMHIQVDPKMTVEESHRLMHNIERTIQKNIEENAHVIIHIEPYFDNKKDGTVQRRS